MNTVSKPAYILREKIKDMTEKNRNERKIMIRGQQY
jgi:hypothetical protein